MSVSLLSLESSLPKCEPFKNKRGETLGRVLSLKRSYLQPQRAYLVLSHPSFNPRMHPPLYRSSKMAKMSCTCCWAVRPSLQRRVLCRSEPVASSFVSLLVCHGKPVASPWRTASMDWNLHNFFVRTPNLVFLVSLESS